jgi:Bacterial RNA polymerase, alpha chain C terminal domain
MNKKPYGPVPVSRIKPEAKTIFEALAAGRPVHISRYGQVVAVIDPPATIPRELLAEYALGDHVGFPELTATEINQGAPASAILGVVAQGPRYVTRKHRVRGFLRRVTDSDLVTSEPSDEQLAERERRLAEYLKTHPDTDIAALANYGDQVDQELGISQSETDVRPQDLLGVEGSQRLLESIKEVSRQFAVNAGDLVGTSPRVLSGRDEIVSEFESLTTEAIAGVAGAVLHGVAQRTKVHEVEAIRLQGIEHRAELALSRLESGTIVDAEGTDIGPSPADAALAADLALPIEDLNLSVRSYNCLKREGIHTVGELVARSEQDLLDIRNFGAESIEDVKQKLTDMGLALRDSPAGFDPSSAVDSFTGDEYESYVETEQY